MSRLTFVLPGYAKVPGGGHKVVYQYANALVERGHDVAVLHMRPRKESDATRSMLAAAILQLGYCVGRRMRPRWIVMDRRVRVRNYGSQVANALPPSDIIIATSVKTADFVSQASAQFGIPGAYLIQHFEDFSDTVDEVERTWRLPLIRIVVSGWLKQIADDLNVESALVRNGIDRTEFPLGPPIADRCKAVLALVSDQDWKRTDLIVSVFQRLLDADSDVVLRTFGTCARPDGLDGRVQHFQDPSRAQLRTLYQQARVYVCASDYEGFGLPVAEAMSCGAAVVSTRNGGVEDFAGESVVLVPPGDADLMSNSVQALLDHELKCAEWSERGEKRIDEMTLDHAVTELEAALRIGPSAWPSQADSF